MSKILFLVNHDVVIYNFRLEIVERFLKDGHEVHISSPYGERIDDLIKLGAVYHKIKIMRHDKKIKDELKILLEYLRLMITIRPDICFGFTIKPNIYGAIAARFFKVPFVANITGLGMALEDGRFQEKLISMYKFAFKNIQRVFFQNEENRKFFVDHDIAVEAHDILPGSGVNLVRFPYRDYPDDDIIKFAFISRIMIKKGIELYLEAAEKIKSRYKNVEFHVCGFAEEEYNGALMKMHEKGIVNYHGMIRKVSDFMSKMHCIIHPTYYPEGMSNVLLEACATGRPIITTNRSGCREIVHDGVNGYMIPIQNSEKLIEAIEKFLALSHDEKVKMGIEARKFVEKHFDRNIVVEKYVRELKLALHE